MSLPITSFRNHQLTILGHELQEFEKKLKETEKTIPIFVRPYVTPHLKTAFNVLQTNFLILAELDGRIFKLEQEKSNDV